MEFKTGQRVKVEFEAVVTVVHESPKPAYVVQSNGRNTWVYPEWAKVTLLDPPGWPPQAGDIWEAEGREWFARKGRDTDDMMMIPEDRGEGPLEAGRFKALNPVLVRRRGQ